MKKCLGLDLGTNCIGWALVDKESSKIVGYGQSDYSYVTRYSIAILIEIQYPKLKQNRISWGKRLII
ncbi:MAG: hypothetical protein IPO92_05310 [Saprospiraceae bacterium]|nr:hypothetical protein [Saprospiraceae bacterium]